ncbi:MAG: CPBP family intramembrane metalloprotease [Acidobacteria bacterium]|nr:CPBP family intramembrane metalloprotease [Acidobacteriota bacterium]
MSSTFPAAAVSTEHPTDARPAHPVFPLATVLFLLTLAAQLFSLAFGRVDAARSFSSIVLPSAVFLSVLTVPSVWLGLVLGQRIGLGAPRFAGMLSGERGSLAKAGRDAGLAGGLGVALGAVLLLVRYLSQPYLPPEIPAYGFRGALGGLAVSVGAAVAEEVWFRLGLMTLLVWVVMKLRGHDTVRPVVAWTILVGTAVAFGMAHLPQLLSYGAGSPFAIGGTVLGNTAVGILYGWCYWRRSLFAAMVAHLSVDVVLHVLPAFVS